MTAHGRLLLCAGAPFILGRFPNVPRVEPGKRAEALAQMRAGLPHPSDILCPSPHAMYSLWLVMVEPRRSELVARGQVDAARWSIEHGIA